MIKLSVATISAVLEPSAVARTTADLACLVGGAALGTLTTACWD